MDEGKSGLLLRGDDGPLDKAGGAATTVRSLMEVDRALEGGTRVEELVEKATVLVVDEWAGDRHASGEMDMGRLRGVRSERERMMRSVTSRNVLTFVIAVEVVSPLASASVCVTSSSAAPVFAFYCSKKKKLITGQYYTPFIIIFKIIITITFFTFAAKTLSVASCLARLRSLLVTGS